LFVGRGSSDPDANGDACKLARILWEGSGYATVETCFIGITHPRLEAGFQRALLYQPKRIVILPHFLFTGTLVKKIFDVAAQQQQKYHQIEIACLPEIGLHPLLFTILREREIETHLGQVQMNCEMCKFRLAAVAGDTHSHSHTHESHHHHHDHHHPPVDPYANAVDYHQKIWQVP
ncbi:MAG: CbiX/SirB N-terminal domain-containing protein, partial [Chroococcidiopsis sp.]